MTNDNAYEKLIYKRVAIRHNQTRTRLCDLALTTQERLVLIDVERDRNGNRETYYQDITDDVIRLYEKMRKDK